MKPNTTLKKIANLLNISISTASRALKNHPDIAQTTQQKVRELAEMMEYEPNSYAINLRTNKSKVFGVMIPAIANFFYHHFIESLEEEARKNGYSLLIIQSGNDTAIELQNLKLCRSNRISGLFVCVTPNTTDIQPFLKLSELEVPVIFFDKVPAFEACNKVCVADAKAAVLAAEALITHDKKQVLAIFGNPSMSITKKRLASFTNTYQSTAPETQLTIAYAHSANAATDIVLQQFAEEQPLPDAIFCMSDEVLSGVMKAVQQLTLTIPQQIGIIAISNGFIPKLYYPEITYVETSGEKLAKLAFQRMMACLNGSSFMQELTLDATLVAGGSL